MIFKDHIETNWEKFGSLFSLYLTLSDQFLSRPSAAILCAAHHHRRRDHRHGPDTHRDCWGLSYAHVHHHSGCGQGRLRRNGVPWQWRPIAALAERWRRRKRHRPVCALQKFPGMKQHLPIFTNVTCVCACVRDFSQNLYTSFFCSLHPCNIDEL